MLFWGSSDWAAWTPELFAGWERDKPSVWGICCTSCHSYKDILLVLLNSLTSFGRGTTGKVTAGRLLLRCRSPSRSCCMLHTNTANSRRPGKLTSSALTLVWAMLSEKSNTDQSVTEYYANRTWLTHGLKCFRWDWYCIELFDARHVNKG